MNYGTNGGSKSAGKQEVKLIILSVSLILLGIVELVVSLYSTLTAEDYTRAIAKYFQCNLSGNNANCMIEYDAVPFGALYLVEVVTDMAIPWILFFYIIKRETVEKIRLFFYKKIIKHLCCSKSATVAV